MKFTFDGEHVQRSTQVANKRDAQTVESAYRTQLALGKIGIEPKKDAPTFEKAVEDFLHRSNIERADQQGTRQLCYFSCECLKKFFGKVKVSRIVTEDVEKFIHWRGGQTSKETKEFIARKTVNFDLFFLKMPFKRLFDAKLIRDNPARLVKSLSEAENAFHVLSLDEEKRYLLACPQPVQDVATIILEKGMRCGEVYQSMRQDVSLEDGYLKVYKGKTRSSVRRVHLSARAQIVLSARMKKLEGENLFPQGDKDFSKPTGNLNKQHLTTIGKLKMKFRLCDCRHTFATWALESGVDLLTLASMLGHSNLKMVSKYAHPSEGHRADAIRRMEKAKTKKKAKAF